MARYPLKKGDEPLPTMRAFFLASWIEELAKVHPKVDEVLAAYQLQGVDRSSLYNDLPLHECLRFTEDLAQMLSRDYLGLELAHEFRMTDLGPAYLIPALAKNLRVALSSLARCQTSWQSDTILDLVRDEDTTGFRYLIQDPAIWPRRQDAEFVLGTIAMIARERISPHWRPVSVEFEHDVSQRMDYLSHWFGAPVTGNNSANVIHIANEDMDQPLRKFTLQEDDIVPLLEQHLLELLTPSRKPLPTWASKTDFLIGKRMGSAELKIDAIAADLSTSVRSLRRHLADEGTSFRALLRERRQITVDAILNSEPTRLKELAYRLNYSDSAVLSRAYKSWTGSAPSRRRAQQNET